MPTRNISDEQRKLIRKHFNPEFSDSKNAKRVVKLEGLDVTPHYFRHIVGLYRKELSEKTQAADYVTSITKAFEFDKEPQVAMVPGSWHEERETYHIPRGYKNTLIINDVHIPFHSVPALQAALNYGLKRGVDSIYINGDLMDFYSLSYFSKDPKFRRFKEEIEVGEVFFQMLREAFPDVKIFYKLGNHEERFERYLRDRAEDFEGLLTIEGLLKLKNYGVEVIDGRQIVKHGKLFLIHGHEIRASSALVNIARVIRLRTSVNTIVGHHHKTQEDYNKDLADQITGSWAVGCLCGLRPDYMPVNNWNHGFAHLESDRSYFEIHNKKIVNGRIV